MVRLRLPSMRDAVLGAILHQTRRNPGRHLQPGAVFYARVGPNFQAARHRWPGHWRPPESRDGEQPRIRDDVGLLDWTEAEASGRVSALASGSRASASMEMSVPKSKGMHVHPGATRMGEVFSTTRGLAVHRARRCCPGQRPAPDGASSLTKPSS